MQDGDLEQREEEPFLRGTVRSAKDHAPIAGAFVCLKPCGSIRSRLPDTLTFTTWTDADGSFQFAQTEVLSLLVSRMGVEVTVMASEYAGSTYELRSFSTPSGPPKLLDFVLAAGHAISGIVTDTDGIGITDASIIAYSITTAQWYKPHAEAASRVDGSFRVEGLPEGVPFTLGVFSTEHSPAYTDAITTSSEPPHIVLRSPGTCLTGRVVDCEDIPVAGAIVEAYSSGSEGMSEFILVAWVSSIHYFARTNEYGEFSLRLYPTRWSVNATTPRGCASCSLALRDPLRVEIKLARETLLAVRFIDADSGDISHQVREGGFNEYEVSRASSLSVRASMPDGSVRGRLVDVDGTPIPGLVVGTSCGNAFVGVVTNDHGAYLLQPVDQGPARIHVQIPCGSRFAPADSLRVDAQSGECTEALDLTLSPSVILEGTLIDQDSGLPVFDAEVRLCRGEGEWIDFPRTREDGRFLVGGWTSSELHFLHREYNELQVVCAGPAQDIVFRVKKLKRILLRVRHYGSDAPVTRCRFDYSSPDLRDSKPSESSTDANVIRCNIDGIYELRLPAWDTLSLEVTVPDDFGSTRQVGYARLYPEEVSEGSVIEINVSRAAVVGLAYGNGPSSERISVSLRPRSVDGDPPAPPIRLVETVTGHFEFHDIPDGLYEVVATAPGYSIDYPLPLTVSHGSASWPIMELSLKKIDSIQGRVLGEKIHAIHGRVLGEDRKPVGGVTISVTAEGPRGKTLPKRTTSSDEHGRYRIEGLRPADYSLTAETWWGKTIVREFCVSHEDIQLNIHIRGRSATPPTSSP